jgi:thiamine biosynthesis lipoprotein
LLVTVFLLNGLNVVSAAESEPFIQHYDGVLGTSLDLTLYGADQSAMEQATTAAIAEIARLEQIFSTYRPDSELMQLNAALSTTSASPELLEVVQRCIQWYDTTAGKFSCRLGKLQALWKTAAAKQVIPDRPEVRHQAREVTQAELFVDTAARTIRIGAPIALDPSGLAKGYIIDKTLAVLRAQLPDAQAIKVDIGGDAIYWGSPPAQRGWQVAVADPNNTADNQAYLATLALTSKAVAASGHESRKHVIARHEFSHILTPRDGWPVENGTSSVVIATDTTTADAVATALTLQSLVEGIDWVNTLDGVEALVVDSAGHQLSSRGWNALLAQATNVSGSSVDVAVASSETRVPANTEATSNAGSAQILTLDYVLPEFAVASYNRPYLAIWISDTAQAARKNLLLLGENARWARENTRWWRRVGRRSPTLLDGVARPTRGPGEYQLQWDGKDDFGNALPAGNYILHLEASRENGDSTYQALPFVWGEGDAHVQELPPDGELGAIRLEVANGS